MVLLSKGIRDYPNKDERRFIKKGGTWKNQTKTGRVVYDRKKHPFTISRLSDILNKINSTRSYSDLKDEALAIRFLNEVVSLGLFPVYLRTISKHKRISSGRHSVKTADIMEEYNKKLYAAYKEQARLIAFDAMEAAGIPEKMAKVLGTVFFDWYWEFADGTIGKMIRNWRRRK